MQRAVKIENAQNSHSLAGIAFPLWVVRFGDGVSAYLLPAQRVQRGPMRRHGMRTGCAGDRARRGDIDIGNDIARTGASCSRFVVPP